MFGRTAFFCFVLTFGCGYAAAQESVAYLAPDSIRLRLTYPADGDTVTVEQLRFSGAVLPASRVRFERQNLWVYPTGAFVGMAKLEPGWNTLVFRCRDRFGTLSDTLRIFRLQEAPDLPDVPSRVDVQSISPVGEVFISPGEVLEVSFRASARGRASFSIPKIAKRVPMFPEGAGNADTGRLYRGSVRVPTLEKVSPSPVAFRFVGKDGREWKFTSTGRIHVLSRTLPLVGETQEQSNVVLTEPHGDVKMDLPAGIRFRVVGERDGFKKVRFADHVFGYLASESVKMLPVGTPVPLADVGRVVAEEDDEWVRLRVQISRRVPFEMEETVRPPALRLTFYSTRLQTRWLVYPSGDETIRGLRWDAPDGQTVTLNVDLAQAQPWGYFGQYRGDQFWLSIRKTPALSFDPDSLLRGLKIAVDAGHGGEFGGAVSPTGLLEKHVNLGMARRVAELLEAEGASIVLTRAGDETVDLAERVRLARGAGAHIFISLHNNSIGPDADPLKTRGTSVYYTTPQSQELARQVYQHLLNLGLAPFGQVATTFAVTRQTEMLAILVEGAFLTHPEDEMMLLEVGFIDEMAQAVVAGVKDFVSHLRPSTERRKGSTENLNRSDPSHRF